MVEDLIKKLLEAGVHFGHQTQRWNPKMKEFIFGQRSGIYIIDLEKTVDYLNAACDYLRDVATKGGRILFVGGGYISFEFAHVAARAGAQVQILHRGARCLAGFDPDLVNQSLQGTQDIGVDVRLSTPVGAIERRGDHLIVHASKENTKQTFEADLVVHGAGRVPEIEDLDLEKAGIDYGEKGVSVNEYLQSVSNPAIYAAGDAAASGGLPLTPVASLEGRVAGANLLERNRLIPDYGAVPTVVFTVPPLASVGLQEAGARQKDLKFKINHADTSDWYSSRRVGAKYSGFKVLVEEDSEESFTSGFQGG